MERQCSELPEDLSGDAGFSLIEAAFVIVGSNVIFDSTDFGISRCLQCVSIFRFINHHD